MSAREEGWWGLACWNALSPAQQKFLIREGYLEFGYRPEGDGCARGAQVAIECMWDQAPGPRFYCLECAIKHLTSVREAR